MTKIPDLITESPLFQWGRERGRLEGGLGVFLAIAAIVTVSVLFYYYG